MPGSSSTTRMERGELAVEVGVGADGGMAGTYLVGLGAGVMLEDESGGGRRVRGRRGLGKLGSGAGPVGF